jgi:ELWxxDGT repeat protein
MAQSLFHSLLRRVFGQKRQCKTTSRPTYLRVEQLEARTVPTGSLMPFNGNLYFVYNDGTHGNELWQTNGTTAQMVSDINPGAASSNSSNLTVFNGSLYFTANDGVFG